MFIADYKYGMWNDRFILSFARRAASSAAS